MEIFREVIGRTSNNTFYPKVDDWLRHITIEYAIPLYVACGCTVLTIFIGAFHLYYVLRFISSEQIQTDLYWIVFMCPAISLCATTGMFLPRSAIFLYAIALVYFMICIFVMVTLMTTLNGSRKLMCERLLKKDVKLSLQVMPIGCCFFCFPKLQATEYNFRRVEWLVFQSPLVRIFLEILNIVVFYDIENRRHVFFQITNVIGMCSLFVGSYGSYIIIPPGSKLLTAYRFSLMFRIVDFSQLAYSVQKFFFDFLAAIGIFSDGPHLPDSAKAQFFTSFILAIEMLIVSVLGTILFRPSQTIFFDKYPGSGSEAVGRLPVKSSSNGSSMCKVDNPVIDPFPSSLPNKSDRADGQQRSGNVGSENNERNSASAIVSFNQGISDSYTNSKSEWHANNVFVPRLTTDFLPDVLDNKDSRDDVDDVSNFYFDSTTSSFSQENFERSNRLSGLINRNYSFTSDKQRLRDNGITNISAADLADSNRLSSFLLNENCLSNRSPHLPDDRFLFFAANNFSSPSSVLRRTRAHEVGELLSAEVDSIPPSPAFAVNVHNVNNSPDEREFQLATGERHYVAENFSSQFRSGKVVG